MAALSGDAELGNHAEHRQLRQLDVIPLHTVRYSSSTQALLFQNQRLYAGAGRCAGRPALRVCTYTAWLLLGRRPNRSLCLPACTFSVLRLLASSDFLLPKEAGFPEQVLQAVLVASLRPLWTVPSHAEL